MSLAASLPRLDRRRFLLATLTLATLVVAFIPDLPTLVSILAAIGSFLVLATCRGRDAGFAHSSALGLLHPIDTLPLLIALFLAPSAEIGADRA